MNPDILLNLPTFIKTNLKKEKIVEFTEIQTKAMPFLFSNTASVVALAPTGSGKTLAYLLPVLTAIASDPQLKVLIVLPTRDLAIQVNEVAKKYSLGSKISSVLLIGGTSTNLDLKRLTRNPNLIIGTPGRIKHHLESLKKLDIRMLVIDEIDKLLDAGFRAEYTLLMRTYANNRKVFFSATLSDALKKSLNETPNVQFFVIDINKLEHNSTLIDEKFVSIQEPKKYAFLLKNLNPLKPNLIFVNTKRKAFWLSKKLTQSGIKSFYYTSKVTVNKRKKLLGQFSSGCMVATDIASRGVDFKDLDLVINYQVPFTPSDYVHRIGRTGRANSPGSALTLVSRNEQKYAKNINIFRRTNNEILEKNKKLLNKSKNRVSNS